MLTGAENVIVGGYTGSSSLTRVVAVYSSDGTRGIRWVDGNKSAIQTVTAGSAPALTEEGTLTYAYDTAKRVLNFYVRTGGATQTISYALLCDLDTLYVPRNTLMRNGNVVLGRPDNTLGALDASTLASNLLVGPTAGSALTNGTQNVIVGGFTGASTTNNCLALYSWDGTRGIRWVEGNGSAIQTITSTAAPTLTNDGTLTMAYDNTKHTVNFYVRASGITQTIVYALQSDVDTAAAL